MKAGIHAGIVVPGVAIELFTGGLGGKVTPAGIFRLTTFAFLQSF
jgi:hypothetical protein